MLRWTDEQWERIRYHFPTIGRALQFLAMIEDMTLLNVASVGLREQKKATEIMRRYSDQDLTMTDAVGLHLMEIQRIPMCWSTDFHLGITGVPLVVDQP